ncbi:unnamed protein product [Acanthosepion pharaonis]|uniref:Uncharacterized protein n=1 Tax=Acanthosepion pharaonis TaxID=158019 RepID=A0A812BUF9_ACAPH|nr:unnamed protein product [Sepia pharaonis]
MSLFFRVSIYLSIYLSKIVARVPRSQEYRKERMADRQPNLYLLEISAHAQIYQYQGKPRVFSCYLAHLTANTQTHSFGGHLSLKTSFVFFYFFVYSANVSVLPIFCFFSLSCLLILIFALSLSILICFCLSLYQLTFVLVFFFQSVLSFSLYSGRSSKSEVVEKVAVGPVRPLDELASQTREPIETDKITRVASFQPAVKRNHFVLQYPSSEITSCENRGSVEKE